MANGNGHSDASSAAPKAADGGTTCASAVRSPRSTLASIAAAFFIGNMFANFLIVLGAVLTVTWRWHAQYVLVAGAIAYFAGVSRSNAHVTGAARTWTPFSAWLHRSLTNYFDTTVITEGGILPGKSYILCFAPHGIHGFGLMTATDLSEDATLLQVFPHLRGKIVGLVAWVLFWVPGVREMFLAMGYRDASAHVVERALREGNSVALIVGGEAESLLSSPGTDRVVIDGKKRRGVFRLALRTGAELVPVFMFGNADTYATSQFAAGFRSWLSKRFQLCLPLWTGRFFTPLPFAVKMVVAYGSPVPLPKVQLDEKGHPSDACIEEYRAAYKAALLALYERHKAKAGYPASRTLEFHASN